MRLLRKTALGAAFTSALVALSASAAHADIILTLGNVPQTDENVLLNSGDIGNPIYGETNNTGFDVRFTSNEDLEAPSSGQARIEADDGAFTYLRVDIPGGSYTSLILNIDSTATGTLDFLAMDTEGGLFNFSNIAIGGSGANFFTFTTINGQRISFIEFTADVPVTFVDAAQFRIGGAQRTTTIPEPASLLLMGTAAAGLVARRVRRRRD